MRNSELTTEQIETISSTLARRIQRRTRVRHGAAVLATGVTCAVISAAVITGAGGETSAPVAAPIGCVELTDQKLILIAEIDALEEPSWSSVADACSALASIRNDGPTTFSGSLPSDAGATQFCESEGRTVLVYLGVAEEIDCTNQPTIEGAPSR